MADNLYRCTRCNTEFRFDTDREALYCPLCGSTARLVTTSSFSLNNILNNNNTSSAKRKFVTANFTDPSTRLVVGSATVPNDWRVETEIQKYNQSEAQPYLKMVKLISPDESSTIIVRSGDNYLDVRNGIGNNEVHQDGKMDQYFNTPMKRFMNFADYVDELAEGFLNNTRLTRNKTGKLNSYMGKNETAAKKLVQSAANTLGQKFKNSQLNYEVKAVAVESQLNEYSYKSGRYNGVLAVGADIQAYEYHLSTGSQGGNNDLMNIFNQFLGGNAQQKKDEGIYINWGSNLVFCLATDKNSYNEAMEVFEKFVSTYRETEGLNNKIANTNTNTMQNLFGLSGSGRPENNTNNNSQGSSFTEMLMNILANSINRQQ